MPVRSPYPDVEIPDVSLYRRSCSPTSATGPTRPRSSTAPAARRSPSPSSTALVDKIAAGAGRARHRRRATSSALFAPNTPDWAAVFHGVLRANAIVTSANSLYTAGRAGPPARRLRRQAARHRLAVPRPRAARRRRGRPARRRGHHARRRRGPSPRCADLLGTTATPPALTTDGASDTAVLPYSSGTTGRAKGVILTHRNLVANLCQVAPMGDVDRDTKILRRAAVLPHLRDDRDDEPGPAQARHGRHDAEVRPRRVPADHLRAPGGPDLHRPAGGRRAGQAPDRRRLRPVLHRRDLLRRRPAGRRAGPRRRASGWAARCCRATG